MSVFLCRSINFTFSKWSFTNQRFSILYAKKVMFNFGGTFMFLVMCLYSCYSAFIAPNQSIVDNMNIIFIMWTSFFSMFSLIIIYTGGATKNEVIRFKLRHSFVQMFRETLHSYHIHKRSGIETFSL